MNGLKSFTIKKKYKVHQYSTTLRHYFEGYFKNTFTSNVLPPLKFRVRNPCNLPRTRFSKKIEFNFASMFDEITKIYYLKAHNDVKSNHFSIDIISNLFVMFGNIVKKIRKPYTKTSLMSSLDLLNNFASTG